MKKLLLTTLLLLFYFKGFSQDTVRVYLNDDYTPTSEESAVFIREVVLKNSHYCLTDRKTDGTIVNYGEYQSLNPIVEHGLVINYDERDSIYSRGYYRYGRITGKWIYYNKDNTADTVYYSYSKVSNNSNTPLQADYYTQDKKTKAIGYKIIDSLPAFIAANFHMPPRALDANINHFAVGIECTIDTEGRIRNPKLSESIHPDIDCEIYRIINLFRYAADIKKPFSISSLGFNYGDQPAKEEFDDMVFVVVEDMPVFPGGDEVMLKYIYDKLEYPEEAKKENIQGKVVVRFCVCRDGTVDKITISRGCHPLLDAEAIRVIKSLPRFTPGKQGGKPVSVWYCLPITFGLK